MIDLKELFEAREQAYKERTQAILDAIPTATTSVADFLLSREGVKDGTTVRWEEIGYFPSSETHEDYIVLTGIIGYAPGSTFTMPNGEVIAITEATKDYFSKIIRVGLPVKIAVEGSAEDIVNYIKSTSTDSPNRPEPVQSEHNAEFDLDQLTEEQKQALMMFDTSQRNKN